LPSKYFTFSPPLSILNSFKCPSSCQNYFSNSRIFLEWHVGFLFEVKLLSIFLTYYFELQQSNQNSFQPAKELTIGYLLLLVVLADSGTISEHGASYYTPSSSPSTASPHSLVGAHLFRLHTPHRTPEESQEDSLDDSPRTSNDESPNSVTTGPHNATKPLQPCKICTLNPAKVCLQVPNLSKSIHLSLAINVLCSIIRVCLGH
jgi:hypothetical protein